jgi:hypothetical protein
VQIPYRAFVDSLGLIGEPLAAVMFWVLCVTVATIFVWRRKGPAGTKNHLKKVLQTIAIPVLVWLPFFIWQLGYETKSAEAPAMFTTPVPPAPHIVVPRPLVSWRRPPGPQEGPFGPILAVELSQEFSRIRPCTVMVTAPTDKPEFTGTLAWILTYGSGCGVQGKEELPRAEEPALRGRKIPGMTIHWSPRYTAGPRIAHWFDASGFQVDVSNKLPEKSPLELIWIDIGPGSPWK